MNTSIDLCCIMKNEERNLPEFMASFAPHVDKVIIVDTGSTDGSVELAKSLGAEVHHFKWISDFSAARNYSFTLGDSAYVMWADLDDSLRNSEAFKMWKAEVMPLADYHLAPYQYANDGKGNSTCSFIRERVVRRSMGFKWKYFLHEGMRPDSGNRQPSVDMANGWDIWHRRTQEDLNADRMRNLSMFQARERELDSRMQFYYGKELFEAGFWDQSLDWFNKAIVAPELEPHDRVLAFQYVGYALLHLGQKQLEFAESYKDDSYRQKANTLFHESIGRSLDALQLDPHRAEFHVNIADAFLKAGEAPKSIPFYEAAKSCQLPGGGKAGPVFNFLPMYSEYPRTLLAQIHAQMGNFPKAQTEAEELYRLHPSEQSKKILDEINKACAFNVISADAKDCDDIVISCPGGFQAFPWDGETYRTSFCGGSETAAIEMAENFVKLGRRVKIFQNRDAPLTSYGVEYLPVSGLFDYFKEHKPWLHIAWRHSEKLTNAFTIAWCHDLMLPGGERTANYDYVTALTPFHSRRLQTVQGIPLNKVFLTRNGLNPEKFVTEPIERDPMRFVFSSSPDRGLDRAMLVLDRVREAHPEVSLTIHYGIEHLEKYGLGALQKQLGKMIDERAWVKYVGKTSQPDLIRSFKKSSYCVAPADWIETSCIASMEQLCSGVYQIRRAVGGVVDTLEGGVMRGMAEVLKCPSEYGLFSAKDADTYAAAVIKAMDEKRYLRVKADPNDYAWSKIAAEWLAFRDSVKIG